MLIECSLVLLFFCEEKIIFTFFKLLLLITIVHDIIDIARKQSTQ